MKRFISMIVVALFVAAMVAPSAEAATFNEFCYQRSGGLRCASGFQAAKTCHELQRNDPTAESKCHKV